MDKDKKKKIQEEVDQILEEESAEDFIESLLPEYQEAKKNYNIAKSIFDKVKEKIIHALDGDNYQFGQTKVETSRWVKYGMPQEAMDKAEIYNFFENHFGFDELVKKATFPQDFYKKLPEKLLARAKKQVVNRLNIEDAELELKRAKKMEEKRLKELENENKIT